MKVFLKTIIFSTFILSLSWTVSTAEDSKRDRLTEEVIMEIEQELRDRGLNEKQIEKVLPELVERRVWEKKLGYKCAERIGLVANSKEAIERMEKRESNSALMLLSFFIDRNATSAYDFCKDQGVSEKDMEGYLEFLLSD